ncbi:MAG: hypothetical protein JW790_03990 [Dehalococcoidales bacterium]|nr:hypothetical protein [Dehalococcoidales bacterium]
MSTGNHNPVSKYWLCPLYSFDCDCDCVDLAEGVQIGRAFRKLRDHIYNKTHDLYGRWDDPSEFDWIAFLPNRARAKGISAPGKLAQIGLAENDRVSGLLVDMVTALRLCHRGMITPGPLISASLRDSEWGVGGTTIWSPLSKSDFLHSEHKYTLYQADADQVSELARSVIGLRDREGPDNLNIPLRRFNSSYHGAPEDKLIDHMIAFESLYLGYDQELKYRLALRVAVLLGRGEAERKTIFGKIRKAYKLRSDIVHGNRQLEWHDLEEIIYETEEYLRCSIRRFLSVLSEGYSLENLRQGTDRELAKLDENILSNGELLN